MIRRMTELGGRSGIAVVNGIVTIVPKVAKVRGGGKLLRDREWITMLRMGPVTAVDVIAKVIVIEAILPSGGGAPGGG